MESVEYYKVGTALLGTIFVVMSLNFLSESIFHSETPETPGYAIEVAGGDSHGGEAAKKEGPAYEPVSDLLASADVVAGQKVAKKCVSCHTFEEGGANKVGPNLYNIVNRSLGSVDGFGYSGAMKAFAEGKSWTYEDLNGFLAKPKAFMKGTAMGFAGVKKVGDRANLIAYLRSLAATPAPLPGE